MGGAPPYRHGSKTCSNRSRGIPQLIPQRGNLDNAVVLVCVCNSVLLWWLGCLSVLSAVRVANFAFAEQNHIVERRAT